MVGSSILEMAATGQAAHVMRDLRVRSLYSPYYLAKVVLGNTKLVPHLHLADTEQFVSRWARGQNRQFIEWPRAFFKTTTFTIGIGIWGVLPVCDEDHDYALNVLGLPKEEWLLRAALHDQDATQLFAFETEDNSKKKLAQIRWHFEENELFRALWPEVAYTGSEPKWNDGCLILRRVGPRRKEAEGTFEAIGVGGALQSKHYSRVWEDDLVGERARKSDTMMADTIGWHGRLSGALENAVTSDRFGVSNRWGFNDLNSYIRNNEPDVVFYTRAAWEPDPLTGEDRSIFPEEYPMSALFKIRDGASMSRVDFSCQYLNSPTLPGEREIDLTRRHYYEVAEDGQLICSCGARWYPSQLDRYMHYDPYNAKVTSTSCPAIGVVGTSPDEHIFVLATWTYKGSYANIFDRLYSFNDQYRPRIFTYEDVANQNMCEFHWREMAKTPAYRAAHRAPPRLEGAKTGGKSKELRIRDHLFPIVEQRKFSTRRTMVGLDSQFETFPHKVFDHDYDLLDMLAQGATVWQFPTSEDELLAERELEDTYLAQLGKPYSHYTATAA